MDLLRDRQRHRLFAARGDLRPDPLVMRGRGLRGRRPGDRLPRGFAERASAHDRGASLASIVVGGVSFETVFEGLERIGYEGYVTVHQAYAELMGPDEAAVESALYLRRVGEFEAAAAS